MTASHLRTRELPRATGLDARWAAVMARDPGSDGKFFYSVKTTGVYCRPSCASRLPKQENVAFHDTPEDAERAGFRPCKRCSPDRPPRAGTVVRFAVGKCSLGQILVARSESGICAILLGDSAVALARDLRKRFLLARVAAGDAETEALLAQVTRVVDNPRLAVDLPLDVRGTAFQQRVWQMLRTIPAGTTVSYAEVARRIGTPRSVRAVAQACGANALAVVVPCHRVVRSDGTPAGYRWGADRKRALLEREALR
jgi:AraC family transcriptional regulator, regulatory protein of adaptative response / methylated-DNA-[protein]-cysteine methyltransferase